MVWEDGGGDSASYSRNNLLFVHNFEAARVHSYEVERPRSYEFAEAVPDLLQLHRVAVFKGERMLGQVMAVRPLLHSGLSIISPRSGARRTGSSKQIIRWAHGPSPPLSALVMYSPDGGKTMRLLGRDIRGDTLTVDPSQIPGGNQAKIYVQLSDGFRSEQVSSARFKVAAKPPAVHIMQPISGEVSYLNMPLKLWGQAYDREEQLSDRRFRWTSNRDGFLGSGQRLSISRLSAGQHRITLTVEDSSGMKATDAITINVQRYH